MSAFADALREVRRWFAPWDDRISEGEYEAFRRLGRRARLRIIGERKRRLCDTWAGEYPFRPAPALMGGGVQGWEETLEATVADGTQISNSVSEALIVPDFSFPAFYMAPGRTLRVWSFGVCSNVVTTPGTLTVRVRWGGLAGTVLLATAAQGMDTTAHTNALWCFVSYHTLRSAGATGTFMSGGSFNQFNLLTTTSANLLPALMGSAGTPGASGNVAVTVSTIVAQLLSVTGQFSVATSPTNLTGQMRVVEVLN